MRVDRHEPGVFNWVDLETTDLDGAKAFYGPAFGWDIEDMPVTQGGVYATARIEGRNVCGLFAGDPNRNLPPHWNTYVSVDDIEATCRRAAALGGKVVASPFDVMDAGRMAVLEDREGAFFSVWQPGAHIGAEIVNEPNTFSWNELYAGSLEAAREFYGGLFGWTLQPHDAMGNPLFMIRHNGREMGTMMELQTEWGPLPPHWIVYFTVENCDEWVAQTKELGAQVFMEPWDLPDVGRFAGVADPQGARLMIIQQAEHVASASGESS